MVYARALNARAGSTPSTPRLVRLPRVQIGLSEQGTTDNGHQGESQGALETCQFGEAAVSSRGPCQSVSAFAAALVPSEQLARDALEGGVRGVR